MLKFSFDSTANLSGQFLNLSSVAIEQTYDTPGFITEVLAYPPYFANGVYTLNVQQAANNFPFNQNYLALYNPPTYPDAQHESYVEGRPVPNTNNPQTINLVVAPYQTLEIQPFTNFRGAKVLNTVISDDIAAIEWWMDFTHKDFGTRTYRQLAVQRWKNGKIVEEKFYYNN